MPTRHNCIVIANIVFKNDSLENDRVEVRLVALHMVDIMRGSAARTRTRLQPQQEAVGAD